MTIHHAQRKINMFLARNLPFDYVANSEAILQ